MSAATGGAVTVVAGGVGAVADEAEDVVDGWVVAELEFVVAGDGVFLADGGEQFGLFDGVDAEVCFEVEVGGEHVGWVAGLFGDEGDDSGGDGVDRPSDGASTVATGRLNGGETTGSTGPRARTGTTGSGGAGVTAAGP